MTLEQIEFIGIVLIIDIILLIIIEILMKKYLTKKIMFPKTKLIKSSVVTNDDLDINNSIFLHMTDGIIAFDRDGKIILINPAAQRLLNILPEHNNFEDIFGKLNLDINLEKIIYLENWTNTEERFQIEDRFVNAYFAPSSFAYSIAILKSAEIIIGFSHGASLRIIFHRCSSEYNVFNIFPMADFVGKSI